MYNRLNVSTNPLNKGSRIYQTSEDSYERIRSIFYRSVLLKSLSSVYNRSSYFLIKEISDDVAYEYASIKRNTVINLTDENKQYKDDIKSLEVNVVAYIDAINNGSSFRPHVFDADPDYLFKLGFNAAMISLADSIFRLNNISESRMVNAVRIPLVTWANGYNFHFNESVTCNFIVDEHDDLLIIPVDGDCDQLIRLSLNIGTLGNYNEIASSIALEVAFGNELSDLQVYQLKTNELVQREVNSVLAHTVRYVCKLVDRNSLKLSKMAINIIKYAISSNLISGSYLSKILNKNSESAPITTVEYEEFKTSEAYCKNLDIHSPSYEADELDIDEDVEGDEDLSDDDDPTLEDDADTDGEDESEEGTDDTDGDDESSEVEEEPEDDSPRNDINTNDDESTITISISDPEQVDLDDFIYKNEILNIINGVIKCPHEDLPQKNLQTLKRIKIHYLFLYTPIAIHELMERTLGEYYTLKVKREDASEK